MRNLNQDIYRCLLPNLLEIQRVSFCWFLEKGLLQELENFAAIRDYLGELELSLSAKQYKIKRPKYSLAEAKRRDTTYSIRIYIIAKLDYLVTSESKKGEVFLGDIPLMTNEGTFLVNGIERIIINQIVRSPGLYYKREATKQNSYVYTASLISNRGTWVKFEVDKDELIHVKVDKAKKIVGVRVLESIRFK
jgi:DNA-directed RNA polymerase subunit beta